MKIGVIKERRAHEGRIAVSPETVKKLVALGPELAIEAGAGAAAFLTGVRWTAGFILLIMIFLAFFRTHNG